MYSLNLLHTCKIDKPFKFSWQHKSGITSFGKHHDFKILELQFSQNGSLPIHLQKIEN
jgi:hypothetical protein